MINSLLPAPEVRGIAVVFGADGKPKVSSGFVDSLSETQRMQLNALLKSRGFQIKDSAVEEI